MVVYWVTWCRLLGYIVESVGLYGGSVESFGLHGGVLGYMVWCWVTWLGL